MFKIKVGGIGTFRAALDRVAAAMSPEKNRRNVRTIGEHALIEVRQKTPGKGTLREAWFVEFTERKTARGGVTARFVISNRLANKTVYYYGAFDGKKRKKLHHDGSPVKWREVIGYLDEGTAPHEIRPFRYKFLVFRVKQAPRNVQTGRFQRTSAIVFAKHVHHPGTAAYGMLTDTREALRTLAEAATRTQKRAVIDAWRKR
mgnify:CR=1 FL=1